MAANLIDHAVAVSQRLNAAVFPVRAFPKPTEADPEAWAKLPLIKDWQNGGAKSDPSMIRDLFERCPNATNVGVQTGHGLLLIDIDGAHAQAFVDAHPELFPATLAQRTRRDGGRHLFYRLPEGTRIKNSAGKLAPKLDVRGDGGYVCDWSRMHAPTIRPIAEAPAALLERLIETTAPSDSKAVPSSEATIAEGSRNDFLTREGGRLRRIGLDEEALSVALMNLNEKHCDPPLDDDEVKKIARSVARYKEPAPEPVRAHKIELKAGEAARALTQLADAMPGIAEAEDLMVYSQRLVHPFAVERPGFGGAPVEVLELNTLSARALASYVDARIDFTAWRSVKGGGVREVRADCPMPLVLTYMDRADLVAGLPQQVTGLAATPVWRDGQLVTAKGFDSGSRKWLLPPEGVALPARLSKKTAIEALDLLQNLLAEFRFASERDAACGVALLLTAATRASLVHAPMFIVTKHEHGEGGSTLCTLASIIQTGRAPAVITVAAESNADAEIEKRIDAAQLAGAATLVLDNFKSGAAVNSTSLAVVVSESERDVRILGQSKNVRCPNTQLVLVNGRNLTVAEDFVRRAVQIELDTKMATPDTRKFKRPNLLIDAARDRAAILSACFAIIAGYAQHTAKHARAPIANRAGFEPWVRLVAEPLAWLGLSDVSAIPAAMRAVDPERALIARLLPAWEGVCTRYALHSGMPAARAIGALDVSPESPDQRLIAVLGEATGARVYSGTTQLQPKAVGYFLRRIAGRIVEGRRLVKSTKAGGIGHWRVERA